jgi:probable rRNA maturation factor
MSCIIYQTVRRAGISHARVENIVGKTLRHLRSSKVSVAVHLIGDARMRRMNRVHRGSDRPTDVLSFPMREKEDWGDIFLSIPYVRRQAKRFDVPFEEEFRRMLIHGLLHLAGFDHDTKSQARRMFRLQESLL